MEYSIGGDNLPVLFVKMKAGEQIVCESGKMSWMDDGFEMQTQAGGLGKMFSRMVSNESAFNNTYIAHRDGEIAFASQFPGSIKAVEVTPGNPIIIQKGAFMAQYGDITSSVAFQKKAGAGFFGGEGFIMRKFEGNGIVFLEIDGSAHEYELAAGQKKIIDTGYLAAMSGSCTMDVQQNKGVKNVLFGGEGLFNTVVTGPGHVIVQSMPISGVAEVIARFIPHSSN